MITRNFIEQDIELQRAAETPEDMKPRFNWGEMAKAPALPASRIHVQAGNEQSEPSVEQIAETVGKAVTDLALSRKQDRSMNQPVQKAKTCELHIPSRSFAGRGILLDPGTEYTARGIGTLPTRRTGRQVAHPGEPVHGARERRS